MRNRTKTARPIDDFLIEELSAIVAELADGWLTQRAAVARGEVQAPLMRIRIVETEAETFEMAARAIGFELYKVRSTIPHPMHDGCAVAFDPLLRTGQRMQ